MPDNQHHDILIIGLGSMALFLFLAGTILLLYYSMQRRKAEQQVAMAKLQQEFAERSLRAQMQIQEETFQSVSQEIHDNVGQLLTLARIQLNIITEKGELDMNLVESAKQNIGTGLMDLRDLSRSMNGARLSNDPLHETLGWQMEQINRTGWMEASVQVAGEIKVISPPKKLVLCRILQECVQNCLKHAEAKRLTLTFLYQPNAVQVTIEDNGKGFTVNSQVTGKGQGLRNMQTRIQLAGGTVHINSRPPQGTAITLTIPYD